MTEKRYKFNGDYFEATILDNGSPMHPNVIANRLNEYEETIDTLHKENQTLKEKLKIMAEHYGYSEDLRRMIK